MAIYQPPQTWEDFAYLSEHAHEPWTDAKGEVCLFVFGENERPLTHMEMYSIWKAKCQNKKRSDLAFALKSRVLTDAEMAKVADLGIDIYRPVLSVVDLYIPSRDNDSDLNDRLNSDLLQQFRLRQIAAKVSL